MELTELTQKQQLALVALIENITLSDGTVAEGEQEQIGQISEKLGEDHYRQLLDEADECIRNIDELKNLLLEIDDQNARNLIYGVAMEETMLAPTISHKESELLDWLKNEWQIKIGD